jgi:aspartate kinase
MLTVEKIGGTSMSRFGEVLENVILRAGEQRYGRVYVVSAYGGVTNLLLEHKKSGEPGIYAKFVEGRRYDEALEQLTARLEQINAELGPLGLDVPEANAFLRGRIGALKSYLDSMRHVLASGYLQREEVLLAAREMLAALGEAHSAYNSVAILRSKGVQAHLIDLTGFDDDQPLTIDERIAQAFDGLDLQNCLAVVTGYTKGTEGIMREFDRGYSEVTFSKIAVRVQPDEARIHKEFHLSSADPAIVGAEHAVVVGQTNYDVADQLADIGMEAIHPRAAKPMELAGIPIRLTNAFEPEHPGTLITTDYVGRRARVEVIAGSSKVTLIEVHDPSMIGTVGFDHELLEVFEQQRVSYILKATNANTITHVVWDKAVDEPFLEALRARYPEVVTRQVAMVCVIGSNIAIPGVLATATRILADEEINVSCISQTFRQVNMQFVIERSDYERAIVALNRGLCNGG